MTRRVQTAAISAAIVAAVTAISIHAQDAKTQAPVHATTSAASIPTPSAEAFFDGAKDPASKAVMQQAEADIQKYRTGDLKVVLVDENGKPVKGEATVDLIRHQFNFGVSMFGMSRKADDDPMKKIGLQTILDIFNQVVVVDHWYNPFGEIEDKQPAKDVAWAEAHNMRMRYHAILYEEGRQFLERHYTQDEYWQAFEDRIKYCADITQRKPSSYDVINEVISRKYWGKNNPQSFYRLVPDYPDLSQIDNIVRVFALARKYLPHNNLTALEAQLPSLNDKIYAEIIAMWKAAIAAGADIDHVGTQCHFFSDGQPFQPEARTKNKDLYTMAGISKGLDLQKVLNKPIEITEFTGPSRSWAQSEELSKKIWTMSEAENSAWQINFYKLAFSKPYIIGVTRWNLVDEYCGRSMDGGVLTKTGQRHQIYYDLKKLIKEEWHTNAAGKTAKDGTFPFHGFYGDYSVTVKGYEPATVTLVPGTTTAKVVLKKVK